MSSPPTLTGVDEPMLVCGAMASRSAAWLIQTPAEAPRAFRRDVDDHRDLRRELGLVDVLHRAGQSTGRVGDHDRVVVLLVRALDLVDVVGGDRIDVVVELDRENARLGRRCEGGRERAPLPPMRSKLPAESGFSRCKDAIKSPCRPARHCHPGVGSSEGLCRRSDRSRVPGHSLGRGDPGHARVPLSDTRSRLGWRPSASTSSASTGRLRPCRVACAEGVRLGSWRRGRSRGGGPPGPRVEEARRLRGWRLGALQWTGEARRLEVRARGRVSRVRTTCGAPRNRSAGRSRWRAARDHHPAGLGRRRTDPP